MGIKRIEGPSLPGETVLTPRIRRSSRPREEFVLAAMRGSRAAKSTRSNARSGVRGTVRIPREFDQRVYVNARFFKLEGKQGIKNLRKHLYYLQRSGVGLDGGSPNFAFNGETLTREEVSKRLAAWQNDPHVFRFIVSPENGSKLNLPLFTRNLMETLEKDLKSKLRWFFVPHYNTDDYHVHIVVRGVDQEGKTLVIDKDYIKHGMRHAAEREATRLIGKRTEKDLRESFERDLTAKRVTQLDKVLLKEQSESLAKVIRPVPVSDMSREWERQLRVDKLKRLAFLKSLGLANEVRTGEWQISDDAVKTLTAVARREKTIGLLKQHIPEEQLRQTLVIHNNDRPLGQKIEGELVAKDFYNELYEQRFMLVSGTDGRLHYVELTRFSESKGFEAKKNSIVSITPAKLNKTDEVIQRVASKNGGIFDERAFLAQVRSEVAAERWKIPGDLTIDEYLARYSTRIETLERKGLVQQSGEREWNVPADLQTKVEELNTKLGRPHPLEVEVKSHLSLEGQAQAGGATWIDKLLETKQGIPSHYTKFGGRVAEALDERQRHLSERGLSVQKGLSEQLRKNEIETLAKEHSSLGPKQDIKDKETFRAQIHRYALLSDGHYVVLKRERSFSVTKVNERQGRLALGEPVEVRCTHKRLEDGTRAMQVRLEPMRRKAKSKTRSQGRGRL